MKLDTCTESPLAKCRGWIGRTETLFHFPQRAGLHVVNKSPPRNMVRNPRMRLHSPHLLAYVFLQIIKGVKMRWRACRCPHLFRQSLFEFFLAHLQQPAVRVVNDDELLRVEQMMRNNQ